MVVKIEYDSITESSNIMQKWSLCIKISAPLSSQHKDHEHKDFINLNQIIFKKEKLFPYKL